MYVIHLQKLPHVLLTLPFTGDTTNVSLSSMLLADFYLAYVWRKILDPPSPAECNEAYRCRALFKHRKSPESEMSCMAYSVVLALH